MQKLEPKLQRKEIQKIKNRISAQSHRDKQKSEMMNLKEENKILKMKVNSLERRENDFLENLKGLTCEKCGESFNFEKHVMPKRLQNYQRTPSNSCILQTFTIFSVLFLFVVHDNLSLIDNNKNLPIREKPGDMKKNDEQQENMRENGYNTEKNAIENSNLTNYGYDEGSYKKDYGMKPIGSKSNNMASKTIVKLFWIVFIILIING